MCSFVYIGILGSNMINVSLTGKIFIGFWLTVILGGLLTKKFSPILIGFAFMLLGVFIYENSIKNTSLLYAHSNEPLQLVLKVQNQGVTRKYYLEYDVLILNLYTGEQNQRLYEKAKLHFKGKDYQNFLLEPGDTIEFQKARLDKNFFENNENGYVRHLQSRRYKSIIEGYTYDIKKLEEANKLSMLYQSNQTRKYIEKLFDETLQPVQSNLMKSILMGNQGYMSEETLTLFSKTGTAHIIAVSGLHVGILALSMHSFLKLFKMSKKRILIITMVLLIFYGYLVNFPVSIIRAMAMYFLYVFAYFNQNRYDAINSLMAVAFILLLYNPLTIYSVSFQLSFCATLGILLFYGIVQDKLKVFPRSLRSLAAVTIGAQLGTMPIMAYHFQQLSLISVFANLFIVPILGIVISMASLSILVSIMSTTLASGINHFLNGMLTYIYWIVEICSNIPYANIKIDNIGPAVIIVYYVVLIGIYWLLWSNRQKYLTRESWGKYEL
jgi:competence protein ComEC